MAKSKLVKKTKSVVSKEASNKDLNLEVNSQLKKSRVWIGLAIVLVALGSYMYFKNINSKVQDNNQVVDLVSPQPSSNVEQVASATPKPAVSAQKVKTLADTNGKVEVTVQNGDSFWKISERACGNGRYFLDIQSALGFTNRTIHAGDKLTVNCPI